ncbi:SDR family oxidoreductase, partial [Kitasatospora sp. NPDC059160]|uniref:SDR family oxidoreductase n=1 Tax=Kitasatospora sp. NPDC059160 TaxID=3346748 RepID=UPI0036B08642
MIVVTGATGNIGRPLTQALAEAGREVTAVSRRAAAVPDGVRHVTADLAEPGALKPVLAGAEALFLLLSGDLHGAGAGPADLVADAVGAGVRRIVLLSSQGVVTRPFGRTRIALRALEDKLRAAGVEWSILRPGGFASNAFWWADSVRTDRLVAAPFGDVGVPVVDPADIAEVAAACLLDERHGGGRYELTGPEVITPRGQAAALAAALGEPVRFHELSREEARAGMARAMPAELADDTLD